MLEFQSGFGKCVNIDLLMQHNFCCGNLIGRSWRTWKTYQILPRLLRGVLVVLFGYLDNEFFMSMTVNSNDDNF